MCVCVFFPTFILSIDIELFFFSFIFTYKLGINVKSLNKTKKLEKIKFEIITEYILKK